MLIVSSHNDPVFGCLSCRISLTLSPSIQSRNLKSLVVFYSARTFLSTLKCLLLNYLNKPSVFLLRFLLLSSNSFARELSASLIIFNKGMNIFHRPLNLFSIVFLTRLECFALLSLWIMRAKRTKRTKMESLISGASQIRNLASLHALNQLFLWKSLNCALACANSVAFILPKQFVLMRNNVICFFKWKTFCLIKDSFFVSDNNLSA